MHLVVPGGFYARVAALPLAMRFAGALLVGEIGFYRGHRWLHEIPYLWRFHAIHHSATEMDWLVNTRAHPLDIVFARLCGFVPIYARELSQPTGRGLDYVGSPSAYGVAYGMNAPVPSGLAGQIPEPLLNRNIPERASRRSYNPVVGNGVG